MKISKKILAVVLAALVLCASLPVMAVSAEEVTSDGIKYSIVADNATVTGYEGASTEVVIPEELGGAPVKYIDKNAFNGKASITSVTFPQGLEEIRNAAFYGCTGLTEIILPDSVTSVGSQAFSGCKNVKTIDLSSSLTFLGASAFAYTAITSVEIPASLKEADHSFLHIQDRFTQSAQKRVTMYMINKLCSTYG